MPLPYQGPTRTARSYSAKSHRLPFGSRLRLVFGLFACPPLGDLLPHFIDAKLQLRQVGHAVQGLHSDRPNAGEERGERKDTME